MDTELLADGEKFTQWILSSPEELAAANPFSAQFECRPIEILAGKGYAKIQYSAGDTAVNFLKIVHGGVTGTLLDETASIAAMTMVGFSFRGTVSMNVTYLLPIRPGPVIGEARVFGYSKSLVFLESTISSLKGDLHAKATITVGYARGKSAG